MNNITIKEETNEENNDEINEVETPINEENGLQRTKKERTEAQKKAFLKAQETRKKNIIARKEAKLKEKADKKLKKAIPRPIIKAKPKVSFEEAKEEILKLKKKKEPTIIYEDATSSDEETIIVKKRKPKKKKKVVYVSEEEDDSDDSDYQPPIRTQSQPTNQYQYQTPTSLKSFYNFA